MNKFFLGVLVISSSVIMGCATAPSNKTGFYWGNYSTYLYEYKKNPNPETLARYKRELERIIKRSDQNVNFKVPPGIYAELGKLYLDEGSQEKALSYFNLEATTFPESKHLMKTLIEKVKS